MEAERLIALEALRMISVTNSTKKGSSVRVLRAVIAFFTIATFASSCGDTDPDSTAEEPEVIFEQACWKVYGLEVTVDNTTDEPVYVEITWTPEYGGRGAAVAEARNQDPAPVYVKLEPHQRERFFGDWDLSVVGYTAHFAACPWDYKWSFDPADLPAVDWEAETRRFVDSAKP